MIGQQALTKLTLNGLLTFPDSGRSFMELEECAEQPALGLSRHSLASRRMTPPVPKTIKESEAVQAIKPSILTAATVQPLLPVKDTSAWLVGGATEKRDSVKGTWAWHLLGHRVCNG